MWYHILGPDGYVKICFADSLDGVDWTKHGIVLDKGDEGSWDDLEVGQPVVVFDGTTYRMWYVAHGEPTNVWAMVGYATSSDGITWTKYSNNPVLVPGANGWEDRHVWPGPVIMYEGEYEMWYMAQGYSSPANRIGLATSPDGFSWLKQGDPVLDIGPPGSWDYWTLISSSIVEKGGDLFMWYAALSEGPAWYLGIGLATTHRAPTKWAVVIGVDEYSYPNKNARGGPGNSAKDMHDILVNYMNFPSDHVHLLIDKVGVSDDDVVRATVEREIKWLQTIATPEDVVVFYYAGHGAQSPTLGNEYIIMHDGDMRDDELTIEINRIESKNLLVILDTSYSGGFVTDGQTLWQGIWGIIPSWTDLASETPSGRIILTSCAENVGPWLGSRPLRDAQELPYWSGGTGWRYEMVFTHLLATGFKGKADSNKDGKVTVEEAFRFARPRALVETPLMYDGYPVYGSSEELYLG